MLNQGKISTPFVLPSGPNTHGSSTNDILDKIYQAITGLGGDPPITADTVKFLQSMWVIDAAGDVHWMDIATDQEDDTTVIFLDAPNGDPTTPSGTVRPTTSPLISFRTIRLDGDSGTLNAVAWRAPTSGSGAVVGSVGRQYVIQPGFRFMDIVSMPAAALDSAFTCNGISYQLSYGPFSGPALPRRGDPGYLQKIDEQYTIIAGAGCVLEITEVR